LSLEPATSSSTLAHFSLLFSAVKSQGNLSRRTVVAGAHLARFILFQREHTAETSGGKWQGSTFVIVVVRFLEFQFVRVSDKLASVSYRQIENYPCTLGERLKSVGPVLGDNHEKTTETNFVGFFQYLLDLSLGCMSSFGFARHSLSVPRIHYVVDLVTIPSY
jgi:hypothetical protein